MIRASLLAMLVTVASCGEVKDDAASADDPKITMFAPDHGPAGGGIMVTITGSGFSGKDPLVVVDGVAATEATATNDSTMTFTLPPGADGHIVDVEVSTDHGFAIAPGAFRYNALPVVLSITPTFGRFSGGTAVTITGRGFQADEADVPTITIGGSPATAVQIVDDKTITATTASADATALAFVPSDFSVSNKNGTGTLPKAFSVTKQGILLTSSNTHNITYLDPITKDVATLPQSPSRLTTCTLAPNGKIVAARTRSNPHHDLVTYDPIARATSNNVEMLEGVTTHDINEMAYVGNTLYVLSRRGVRLYSVSEATGALTGIGVTNGPFGARAGIAPKDAGNLWWVHGTSQTLDTISVTTGAVTAGPTMSGGGNFQTRGVANVGGVLYIATSGSPTLVFTVNTTTGALTPFASVSASSVTGMCQTPAAF